MHPFNPRIAMSAGYDGKTIVWDVSLKSFVLVIFSHKASLINYSHLSLCEYYPTDMGRYTDSHV